MKVSIKPLSSLLFNSRFQLRIHRRDEAGGRKPESPLRAVPVVPVPRNVRHVASNSIAVLRKPGRSRNEEASATRAKIPPRPTESPLVPTGRKPAGGGDFPCKFEKTRRACGRTSRSKYRSVVDPS